MSAFLQDRGWFVIPSYDYCGENGDKAPKAQGVDGGIILPDLGVAGAGRLRWAEVKYKSAPTFTLLTRSYDHGISLRHWAHYRRAQQETGAHVWLFIIEGNTQKLLVESLDHLAAHIGHLYEGEAMDPGGMIFWTRQTFRKHVLLNAIPGLFEDYVPLFIDEPER